MTDLKSRGASDLFLVRPDGRSGFPEAIQAVDPPATVQLCIVHLGRAALRHEFTSDSREVVSDLKKICQAAVEIGTAYSSVTLRFGAEGTHLQPLLGQQLLSSSVPLSTRYAQR